jgi:hypothetical protein
MLALTVSASLTPANARGWFCDNVVCLCQSKCPRWLRCDPLIRYQSNQSLLHLEESRLHLEGCERAFSEELGVQERVLLFCLASGTDWRCCGTYDVARKLNTRLGNSVPNLVATPLQHNVTHAMSIAGMLH